MKSELRLEHMLTSIICVSRVRQSVAAHLYKQSAPALLHESNGYTTVLKIAIGRVDKQKRVMANCKESKARGRKGTGVSQRVR